jgi:hypothetical protein
MIILSPDRSQYLLLSEALKDVPGRQFERHRHPAVILDRATGPGTQVWGWWTSGSPARPCLLWSTGRGWGATVVEPAVVGAQGYERGFWLHRLTLLDRALARALGPCSTLHELELQVPSAGFGPDVDGGELSGSVLWGVRLLRAAHGIDRDAESGPGPTAPRVAGTEGAVDEELARHALVPTLAKACPTPPRTEIVPPAASASKLEKNQRETPDQGRNVQNG